METERAIMRPYPTGAWGREMSGDDHHWAIGEVLEQSPACRARHFRIYAKTAVELGFGALQRRMHDITAQDHGCLRGPRHDADMSGCVPRPGLDPYVVVKRIIRGNDLGLATLHDRQHKRTRRSLTTNVPGVNASWCATASSAATIRLSSKRAVAVRPIACMSSTKPVSSVSSCVIFGWVTKVPLPLRTSTRPRSTKF